MLPSFNVIDGKQLRKATFQVIQAIQFAQSEAKRTGIAHGVSVRVVEQDIRLYWLDTSGATPVPKYNIRHPISKNLYQFQFGTNDNPTTLDAVDIRYKTIGSSTQLEFSGGLGFPQLNNNGTLLEFKKGDITLRLGDDIADIAVDKDTGIVEEL